MTEAQNMEKIIKALKVVVMDVTKKMEQLSQDFEGLKEQIKSQDGEIQAISKMVNQTFEFMEGGVTATSVAEAIPHVDDEKLRSIEDTLEATKTRVDQMQTKLTDLETVQQPLSIETAPNGSMDLKRLAQLETKLESLESKSLEATPSGSADLEELTQLKTKFESLETKFLAIRGKLADVEDALPTGDRSAQEIPSTELKDMLTRLDSLEQTVSGLDKSEPTKIDLSPISTRLDMLETTVSHLETPKVDLSRIITRLEALEASASSSASISIPEREPSHAEPFQPEPTTQPVATEPAMPRSEASSSKGAPPGGVLTMKDKVLTIVEEQVSTNAMKIATNLGQSTASIRGVLKQLEAEGIITLSGDVDSNPDVKLA